MSRKAGRDVCGGGGGGGGRGPPHNDLVYDEVLKDICLL